MKRVLIAVALAIPLMFGSSASAGGQSYGKQVDSNFIKVGSSGSWKGVQPVARTLSVS